MSLTGLHRELFYWTGGGVADRTGLENRKCVYATSLKPKDLEQTNPLLPHTLPHQFSPNTAIIIDDDELYQLLNAWPKLPRAVRHAILHLSALADIH